MTESAKARYRRLASKRQPFLDKARRCAELTLPYLITEHGNRDYSNFERLYNSCGAESANALASKIVLAILPPTSSFFKLSIDEPVQALPEEMRADFDKALGIVEQAIMKRIADSHDRVVIQQAMLHLVVGGNSMLFMPPDSETMRHFPLSRYVVDRDGNGNVIEHITVETVHRSVLGLPPLAEQIYADPWNAQAGPSSSSDKDEVNIYTRVYRDYKSNRAKSKNKWRWAYHQETEAGQIITGSEGWAPADASPWIVLRYTSWVDGEDYGRGRVEEYIEDLEALSHLSKTLVEGVGASAKVIWIINPGATVTPKKLAETRNGECVVARPTDLTALNVGKTADFAVANAKIQALEQRIRSAFLQLSIRDSERTTASEIRNVQLELERQLSGLFSLLTAEFLIPYLNRLIHVLTKARRLPAQLKDKKVKKTIVAGINSIGRSQEYEKILTLVETLQKILGPEAALMYLKPQTLIDQLASALGLSSKNLIKSQEEVNQEQQRRLDQANEQSVVKQAAPLLKVIQEEMSKNNSNQPTENLEDGN
ncbi:hypothetical protein OMCYN_01656 [cyanobiont of Ornithocercus magnificus]|nr:hypothetical protein OMCYN_01656 [cyanobiont of Ornithocercus magnificus]